MCISVAISSATASTAAALLTETSRSAVRDSVQHTAVAARPIIWVRDFPTDLLGVELGGLARYLFDHARRERRALIASKAGAGGEGREAEENVASQHVRAFAAKAGI